MLFEDTYKTIATPAEGLFKDRGSKFLAIAQPIIQEKEVKEIVENLRKTHPKANHHCWALRLGMDRSNFKLNDDGEPSGTAGRPILNILLSQDITNVLVVVTRYFGGTLLGVPGLINAYKSATIDALANAQIVEQTVQDLYKIEFDFLAMNDVMKIVKTFDLTIQEQQFDNNCSFLITLRKTLTNQVLSKLEKIEGLKAHYIQTL
jgi:uncharacterized YigZ family protein